MTPYDMLCSLKKFCEENTADLISPARDTGEERPPKVFVGELPEKEGRTKQAPYILLKLLTGKDAEESTCQVRIIVTTFHEEDRQENYLQCLNVLTRLRQRLLEKIVIERRYVLKDPLEYVIYDNDTEVYQVGELLTTWGIPTIEREV